jgi:hypothetical protein
MLILFVECKIKYDDALATSIQSVL